MTDLKQKTILGLLWSALERFGYTFIMFISNLFLARLLSPDDFGLIGMIMVFITVSNVIVDSGFASALIQTKEIGDKDLSTVFHINVILAIVLYIILYLSAPAIACFYHQDTLIDILRMVGIVLLFNAFSIVQIAKLKRELNFKLLSVVTVFSSLIGCCIGVFLAYRSFGVWALVFQNLMISLVRSLILWMISAWKPAFIFSVESFRKLFRFGAMILSSQLVDTIYTNVVSLIVGKAFSAKTLGIYTQARTLENVPNYSLITIVNQVIFPVFSKLNEEPEKLKNGMRKSVKALVWVNFPLMSLLIVIAEPLFCFLYTDKWIEAVPLFQIACAGGMMNCIVQLNMMVLAASGKGYYYFISRLFRQLFGVLLICVGLYFYGLWGLMYLGVGIAPYCFWFICVIYTKKVLDYGFKEQLADMLPAYLLSVLCGVGVYFLLKEVNISLIFLLLIQITFYVTIYILFSKLLKLEAFTIYYTEMKRLLRK